MSHTLAVTFWTFVENMGDGSCCVRYFNTREEAESYAESDDERFCEDINEKTLFVDAMTGKLLNPHVTRKDG